MAEDIEDIPGVTEQTATELRAAGYASVAALREADRDELADLDGVQLPVADRIKTEVGNVETETDEAGTDETETDEAESERYLNEEMAVPEGGSGIGGAVDGTGTTRYCSFCGVELDAGMERCPSCERRRAVALGNRKSPLFAVLLSLVAPGLGQIYTEQPLLGLFVIGLYAVAWTFALAVPLVGLFVLLIVLWSVLNGYSEARTYAPGDRRTAVES